MKIFNVQQISEMLNTNPETVRRWIRSGKLKAEQDSRKSGNLISEDSLKKFMLSSSKYAGLVATVFAPTTIALPVAMGGLVGTVISAVYGQKKLKITSKHIEEYLKDEIGKLDASIAQKKTTINQLQMELYTDEKQLNDLKKALDIVDFQKIADLVNGTLEKKSK